MKDKQTDRNKKTRQKQTKVDSWSKWKSRSINAPESGDQMMKFKEPKVVVMWMYG